MVDPSTNRQSASDVTMLRLMLRPRVEMESQDAKPGGEDGSEEATDASEERRGRAVQRSSCQARRVRTLTHQCQD